ncbi:hypothetical protein M3212_02480 [Alkalihalobacillus oceani]|uniref:hypothetical protein n=1 Tax=Halalkalibacter oceani TaxID=1653776 RepID=UPI00204105CB|nr:hypothetical protein [Halalkalibacter oceani]MCM3759649.1 hypothetical protein [Halalkalibacter oceani]
MSITFRYDSRLGIPLPVLSCRWEEIDPFVQERTLLEWEEIRGTIPDKVKELEQQIEAVHAELSEEEDFERSCALNLKMAELASVINDLWIYFRTTPTLSA